MRENARGRRVESWDGVSIRYDVHGTGDPALVFVHCWSCNRSYWQPQVDYFAPRFTVVALDLAGHGESGAGRTEWTMAAFGRDVAAVVQDLELKRVVLVGHSMGGSVIIEAATLMPERVEALVAVDTLFDVEQIMSREQSEQFLAAFRADFSGTTERFLRENLFTPQTDPAIIKKIVSELAEAPPRIAIASMEALLRHDLPAALEAVEAPIRSINSDRWPTKIDVARRYAPSFDVALVPGVGHFIPVEAPNTFNRLLVEAVDELVSKSKESRGT